LSTTPFDHKPFGKSALLQAAGHSRTWPNPTDYDLFWLQSVEFRSEGDGQGGFVRQDADVAGSTL
jgi:hypothetical protein